MSLSRQLAILAALVLALAAVGCGGDDEEDTPAGSGGGSAAQSETSGSVQETAKERVAEYEQHPTEFPGPTEPFDPGQGRAQAIACGFAAPVCATQAEYATEALEALGWEVDRAYDGEFSPQKQSAFLNSAVQRGLDAVIMVSVDVSTIKASVDRALDAGLVIACTFCISGDEYEDKIIDVRPDFREQGEMQAWATLARSGDKANTVHFNDKAFDPPPIRVEGWQAVMEENCPDCDTEVRDFATASIAEPGPPEFNALLSAKAPGTITDVTAHYDGLGIAMAKTLQQRGRDEVAIGAYDWTPESVQFLIRGDTPYQSSSVGPYTYAEWAAADLVARRVRGEKEWEGRLELPNVLITPTNAERYKDGDPVPDGDWQGEFREIWGTAGQ